MGGLNLYQKLVEVRKSIEGLQKDGKSFNYTYVSGTQVLSKIKGKMDELGLLCFPSVMSQSHESFHYKDKYNKDKHDFLVYGNMVYRWINADNPKEVLEVPFEYMGQQDDISKAFGSGLTYSERYFLLKFFGVPTDDEDPDAKRKQEQPKEEKKQRNNKPEEPKPEPISPETIGMAKVLGGKISEIRKTDMIESFRTVTKNPNFQMNDIETLSDEVGKKMIKRFEEWIVQLENRQKQTVS